METKEISQEAWDQFCARLTELASGLLVTIQLVQLDGTTLTIAEHVPFRSVALDRESDACNNTMIIEAELPGERDIRHFIVEPIHLRLKNGQNDRYNHLYILAESGTTILEFSPGLNPEFLEGVVL